MYNINEISRIEHAKKDRRSAYLWLSQLSNEEIFKLKSFSNCVDNKVLQNEVTRYFYTRWIHLGIRLVFM
jgi:hypothetical protein